MSLGVACPTSLYCDSISHSAFNSWDFQPHICNLDCFPNYSGFCHKSISPRGEVSLIQGSTSRQPRHSFGVLTSHVISQLRFPSSEIHWSVFLSHTVNVRDVQTHCEFLNKSLFESKQTTMGSKISNAPERKFCSFFYAFKIKRGCEEGSKVVEEGKVGTGLHDSEQDCVLP